MGLGLAFVGSVSSCPFLSRLWGCGEREENRYGLTFWLCHDPGFYFAEI